MTRNTIYETPEVKLMEFESEGVLCASGAGNGIFKDYDEIDWD